MRGKLPEERVAMLPLFQAAAERPSRQRFALPQDEDFS
jgi:hypothetical protein